MIRSIRTDTEGWKIVGKGNTSWIFNMAATLSCRDESQQWQTTSPQPSPHVHLFPPSPRPPSHRFPQTNPHCSTQLLHFGKKMEIAIFKWLYFLNYLFLNMCLGKFSGESGAFPICSLLKVCLIHFQMVSGKFFKTRKFVEYFFVVI